MTDEEIRSTAVYNDDITFLGEEDFEEAMEGECARWLKEHVREGFFNTRDNIRVHFYTAIPERPKAAVVISHGLCEFFGKYHETAWYLYRAGYAVLFIEHRGHGHSEGKLPEPDRDVVYTDSYDTYLDDFTLFMDRIVKPAADGLDLILFAHSMGGAIGTLFIESHPSYFKAAVFSSPMFNIRVVSFPVFALPFIDTFFKISGLSKKLPYTEKHFSEVREFEKSGFGSMARYDYQLRLRIEEPDYRTAGPSLGWAIASLRAIDRLLSSADRIKIPVTLLCAGNDSLVGPSGYEVFASRVPQCVRKVYPESGHEVFNADTPERHQFFKDLLDTVESYTSG